MPKFRKLRMSYNPNEVSYSRLSTELIDVLATAEVNPNFMATQACSFAESTEIINQAQLRGDSSWTIANGKKLVEYKERQDNHLVAEYTKKVSALGRQTEVEKKTVITDSIENIYGKAVQYDKGREESLIAEYQRKSNRDAKNFGALTLIKDDKKITINNLSEEAAIAYKKEAENLTMSDLISHLEKEYDVIISENQANFLRSSWNQASLQGLPESMIIPSIKYNQSTELLKSDHDSREQSFIFRNSKLDSIKMSQNIVLYDTDTSFEVKSAELKIEADISNLRDDVYRKGSDASTVDLSDNASDVSNESQELDAQGFLPRVDCQPKRVTIEFNSNNGLACSVVPQVLDPLVRYTDFKGHKTSINNLRRLAFDAVPGVGVIRSRNRNKVGNEVVEGHIPVPSKKSISR